MGSGRALWYRSRRVCPSTCRSTETTPTSSAASTPTSTDPLTVAPDEGDEIEAVGAATSVGGATATTSSGRKPTLPSFDRNEILLLVGVAMRRPNWPSPVTRVDRSTSYQVALEIAPSVASGVVSAGGLEFQFMVLSLHVVSATRENTPPTAAPSVA